MKNDDANSLLINAGLWRFLPLSAFILIMVSGFVVSVLTLSNTPSEGWDGRYDLSGFVEGKLTAQISRHLNEKFLATKPFSILERAVQWSILGDAGSAVRQGCPDWFFLVDEFQIHPHADTNAQSRASIVSHVAQMLSRRSIRLVITIVPDKSRMEQEHLCGLHRSVKLAARIDEWISSVMSENIPVIDLRVPLQVVNHDTYYKTDSHWNEVGAQLAAGYIARELHSMKIIEKPEKAIDPTAIKSIAIERSGDLFRVSNLDALPGWLRPAAEVTQVSVVSTVASTSDDLFDASGLPPVVLVGTSFSRTANFVPFLSQYLALQVANLAKDGGDFDGAALSYLRSESFNNEPPKIMLWEVPERMLQKSLTRSEQLWIDHFVKESH